MRKMLRCAQAKVSLKPTKVNDVDNNNIVNLCNQMLLCHSVHYTLVHGTNNENSYIPKLHTEQKINMQKFILYLKSNMMANYGIFLNMMIQSFKNDIYVRNAYNNNTEKHD